MSSLYLKMNFTRFKHARIRSIVVAAFFFGALSECFAGSTPRLSVILPRGAQRGHEHKLRFSGERLSNTQEIFFYDDGIEVLEIKQIDDKKVDVKVKIASDCRIGEHIAQIRTKRGISDFRSFYVGDLPHVEETEPNNSLTQFQAIGRNQTVYGKVTNEDIDIYQIECKKGERLSVEVQAIRLGFMFDPFIAVLDEEKFELAISDDSNLGKQDGVISVEIPNDGKYFVMVRESSYGGNGNSRYLLHVGNYPRPAIAFPLGAPAGVEAKIQYVGDAFGIIEKSVFVSDDSPFRSGHLVTDELGTNPTPVAFRVSDLANNFEAEPNENRNKVEPSHSIPCAFNGIIKKTNDMDYFKFNARKGEVFDVECYARRLNSGLDPVINIFNSKGKHLQGDDDARRPDCYLRFTVPEDGDYYLRVRDHLNRGQEDFVYRVEFQPVKPSLSISIPRVDRYSQLRQQICVPRGNRFATMISADRKNFGGEIILSKTDWPAGVSATCKPMVSNLNLMPIVFNATEEAELSGKLVDVYARHLDESKKISGSFYLEADFALGPPNNARYFASKVDRLACAVTEKVPFKIEISQPKVPLVRNGSMNLKIMATREEGFDQPINVQFPFRPPGLGTKPQIQIKKGESEAYYPLNANGNAQLGKWPVYAIAQANVDGPVWVSSQLAELEIAEPYVTMEINRTAVEQGKETTVFCKLNHHSPFSGKAIAELLGIPPNIEINRLSFDSKTQDLKFTVKTNAKSRIGKHKGLFCKVTIPQNGEDIVGVAARSELQINKPKPKPNAPKNLASKTTESKKIEQKPKSRLQQLRESAANSRSKK